MNLIKPHNTLHLYNYRTRSLDPVTPTGDQVGFYSCGPTVYNPAHIGNLRSYVFADMVKRTLNHFGYQVHHVMNITDVEDKIIRDAASAEMKIAEFTKPHEERFFDDLARLHIEPAHEYPRATAHIPEMIVLIERLMSNGLAYASDGSIYFSIRKFPHYGALSGMQIDQLKAGARVDVDEYDKETAEDFVLWKAAKPIDEQVGAVWDSPWGKGRPGWHIECSAMSMKYLGESFDLHTGGIDNLFPHHEDEVAQSEGATDKPFARIFAEGDHLFVENQKMAKSLGNIVTLTELTERGIEPLAFRYLVLTAHYRSKLNFTWESVKAAQEALHRVRELQYREETETSEDSSQVQEAIDAALADDLDTPRALALLHEAGSAALWRTYDPVLGLNIVQQQVTVTPQQAQLLDEREEARKNKDFTRADEIREELLGQGWEIEDTLSGSRLLPKK